jgi:hypothetical protein
MSDLYILTFNEEAEEQEEKKKTKKKKTTNNKEKKIKYLHRKQHVWNTKMSALYLDEDCH